MKSTVSLLLVLAMGLSSCATSPHLSAPRELASVSVAPSEIEAGAYDDPKGAGKAQGDGDAARQAGVNAGVAAGGLLGVATGMLIGETVASIQETGSPTTGPGYFSLVRRSTPKDLDATLNTKLKESLKRNRYFGPRLQKESPNQITSKIVSYRLVHQGQNLDNQPTFIAEVEAEIVLRDESGKKLAGGTYEGRSKVAHTLTGYAVSPENNRKRYTEAVSGAVLSFIGEASAAAR